jgi:undecaprenyl-diphosphatase
MSLPLMIDAFDKAIIAWFRDFADTSWIIDYSSFCIADNNLLKGGVFLAVVWGFWFRRSGDQARTRALIISTLAAGLLAIGINEALKMVAPMRIRPYAASIPDIYFPIDLAIKSESSFPSDHASLFFALATGFWFLSRRTAVAAFLYTAVVICVPRICLGLHYPSDLLAGMCIGAGSAWLVNGTRLRGAVARPALAWAEKYPALFYTGFFLFSYLLATLFDDLRDMALCAQVIFDNS